MKQEVTEQCRKKNVCPAGFRKMQEATNFPNLVRVLKEFLPSLMNEYGAWTVELVATQYTQWREDFKAQGFAYNEGADTGIILLYNSPLAVAGGNAEIYAYGTSRYVADDRATVFATGHSCGTVKGHARVMLEELAQCTAEGYAEVTANGQNEVTANGAVKIWAAGESKVTALRWQRIMAMGHSRITAPVKRGIEKQSEESEITITAHGK